jgi:hypothetical protein
MPSALHLAAPGCGLYLGDQFASHLRLAAFLMASNS